MKFKRRKSDLNVNLPAKITSNIAEFIGIHFGDGCMTKSVNYTYRVIYAFNSKEIDYVNYFSKLFYDLFNIVLRKRNYKHRNCIELYHYSKYLCNFLNSNLKIPYSPKIKLQIPKYILQNVELSSAFLRGLFDTDGCCTFQNQGKYSYLIAKITTGSQSFAD